MTSLTQEFKREYRAWNMLKNACTVKENRKYRLYGAKGFTFCKNWMSFETFIQDMGGMPITCDCLKISEKEKEYNKFSCVWAKSKPGFEAKKKGQSHKTKKVFIKNSMSFCLTIDSNHYAYIKRQAIAKSQQTGEIYTTNDLIRESLQKSFPLASQYDMFGGKS